MSTGIEVPKALDAIPVVQSTADRTTRFPTPADDQRVFNKGTGAIERFSVASNAWLPDFRPVNDIHRFGGVGDGGADDTAALNTVFAQPNTYAYLPAGTYLFTANLTQPACAGIIGDGEAVTILQAGPLVTTGLPLGGACAYHHGYRVLGNSTANATGIVFGATESGAYRVDHVRVKGFTGTGAVGVRCTNALKSQFDKLTVERNSTNLLIDGTGGITGMPTTLAFDCLTCIDAGLGGGGGIGQGVKIVTADAVTFTAPVFDSCLAEAVMIQPAANGTVVGVEFINPRFEANNTGTSNYQVVVDGSASACTARVAFRSSLWFAGTSTAKSMHITGAGVAGYLLDNPQVLNATGTLVIDAGAYGQIVNWPRNLARTCVSDTTGQGSWGTCTPTVVLGAGSVTYTTQTGTWTRANHLVTVQLRVVVNTVATPSGALQIGGLPFTASATSKGAVSVIAMSLASTATHPMVGQVDAGATTLRLYRPNGTGGLADPGADLQAGSVISVTASYEV